MGNGARSGLESFLRFTVFANSIVGYVDNPAAILTRGLAHGLTLRGNEVRIVEPRQSAALVHTLETAGSHALRHFHDTFPQLRRVTFELRSGAALLEWVARELAILDVAIAVGGLDDELCRWIANVDRQGLRRIFLTWSPDDLSAARIEQLELRRFDAIASPRELTDPALPWIAVEPSAAQTDLALPSLPDLGARTSLVDPLAAATQFERQLLLMGTRVGW